MTDLKALEELRKEEPWLTQALTPPILAEDLTSAVLERIGPRRRKWRHFLAYGLSAASVLLVMIWGLWGGKQTGSLPESIESGEEVLIVSAHIDQREARVIEFNQPTGEGVKVFWFEPVVRAGDES